jgi:hypothetical protein
LGENIRAWRVPDFAHEPERPVPSVFLLARRCLAPSPFGNRSLASGQIAALSKAPGRLLRARSPVFQEPAVSFRTECAAWSRRGPPIRGWTKVETSNASQVQGEPRPRRQRGEENPFSGGGVRWPVQALPC